LEQFCDDAFHRLSPVSGPAPGFDHAFRLGQLAYNPRTQRYNVCFALIVSPIFGPRGRSSIFERLFHCLSEVLLSKYSVEAEKFAEPFVVEATE
jgi:hypothetical protein